MPVEGLHFLSIAEAGRLLRSHAVTSVELTQLCLDRIARYDPQLFTTPTVTAKSALAEAAAADDELAKGKDRGPLHGIPIGLKDLYNTAGVLTTGNSRVMAGSVPAEDATVVKLLREAGSVFLGKHVMHEFATGTPANDCLFPPARNPWGLERIPGGSSSGTGAALAAGLCFGGLGSDTGGSIRGPASFCGIVGHKPTFGLVSRNGVLNLSWSLDHAGPMARTVEDCALLLQAIAGHDETDSFSAVSEPVDYSAQLRAGIAGMRVGVPQAWLDGDYGISADVKAAFDEAVNVMRGLGAQIVTIDSETMIKARTAGNLILISEAYAYHENDFKSRPEAFGAGVLRRLREGAFITGTDYVQAQRARKVMAREIERAMSAVDVVALPSGTSTATPFENPDMEAIYRNPSLTMPFNVTGQPAISLPCGFAGGLPIGLQIAGHAFEDAIVLRAAWAYEQATSWHNMHPEL